MRVGIIPCLDPQGGGVYQYSLNVIRALRDLSSKGLQHDVVVFTDRPQHVVFENVDKRRWRICPLDMPSPWDPLRRWVGEGPHRELWRWARKRLGLGNKVLVRDGVQASNLDAVRNDELSRRWFIKCGVDCMMYCAFTPLAFESGIPYIFPIHDLQHRLQPEFAEVSANGEWEYREYCFRNGVRYATAIVVDSAVGKEDVISLYGEYGVTPERVHILPYLPACYLDGPVQEGVRLRVGKEYNLPLKYLFYPSQFWPHKNHEGLVRALGLLKQRYTVDIPMVFCGSKTNTLREKTFDHIMNVAKSLDIDENISYLGYVPDLKLSAIYSGATALVMPTFFGPSNIPVLEAWAMDCPVLTSDIRGCREQAGDAAVLVDPHSIESIAEGIQHLWSNEQLRHELVRRGRRCLKCYTRMDFQERLALILDDAVTRIQTGKYPACPGARNVS